MTDRELLEAAAKAAGIEPHYPFGEGEIYVRFDGPWAHRDTSDAKGALKTWNPLTDDGDALRLAVKLKLKITIGNAIVMVESRWPTPDAGERFDSDDEAASATRRAIVCAAAAMAG